MSQLIGGIQKVGEKVLENPVGKFLLVAGVSGVLAVMSHIPSVLGATTSQVQALKTESSAQLLAQSQNQINCSAYAEDIKKLISQFVNNQIQANIPVYKGPINVLNSKVIGNNCFVEVNFPNVRLKNGKPNQSIASVLSALGNINGATKIPGFVVKPNGSISIKLSVPLGSIQEIANLGTTQLVSDETPSAEQLQEICVGINIQIASYLKENGYKSVKPEIFANLNRDQAVKNEQVCVGHFSATSLGTEIVSTENQDLINKRIAEIENTLQKLDPSLVVTELTSNGKFVGIAIYKKLETIIPETQQQSVLANSSVLFQQPSGETTFNPKTI